MSAHTEGKLRVEPGTTLIWSERDPEDATSWGFGYPIAKCLTDPCSGWAKGPSADEGAANAARLALCWNMHGPLVEVVEALLGGKFGRKCPECKGWGEVAYFGELVGCRCNGDYRHIPTKAQIDEANALLTRIKEQKS